MARYRALTDLTLPDGSYIQAGSEYETDASYQPPTNACQPLDDQALTAYHAEGPRGCDDAEPWRALFTNGNRWTGIPVPGPSIQWVKEGKGWILKGT
jgi:hypothetical protein